MMRKKIISFIILAGILSGIFLTLPTASQAITWEPGSSWDPSSWSRNKGQQEMWQRFIEPELELYTEDQWGPFRNTEQKHPAVTIIRIIKIIYSILGIIFLLVILYGGFTWMFAGGVSEKTQKARSILINGVIGLVIIIASYAITVFVIQALAKTTT